MNKLDSEEKEILEAFESGQLKRVKGASGLIGEHQKISEVTFKKDARRVSTFACLLGTSGHFKPAP